MSVRTDGRSWPALAEGGLLLAAALASLRAADADRVWLRARPAGPGRIPAAAECRAEAARRGFEWLGTGAPPAAGFVPLVREAFICRAVAGRDPGLCGGLEPWERAYGAQQRMCREEARDYLFVLAALSGRGLPERCRAVMAHEEDLRPDRAGPICSAFAQAFRSGRDACESLSEHLLAGRDPRGYAGKCRAYFASLRGPQACPEAGRRGLSEALCVNTALILRAWRSGKPDSCGGSPLCRAALSGSSGPCAEYLGSAAGIYCGLASVSRGGGP